MNKLSVALEPDYREIDNGKLFLKVNLTIDGGCPLECNDDDFDIAELINSGKKDGTYFIWTCSCGDPGCGGYFKGIQVTSNDEFIIWEDNDLKKVYKFQTVEVQNTLIALYDDVVKWNLLAQGMQAELNIWPSWTMSYLLPAIESK